jgi:hypothetical protein
MTTNGGKYRYNPNLYAEGVSHSAIFLSNTSPSIHIPLTHLLPCSHFPLFTFPSPSNYLALLTFPSAHLHLYSRAPYSRSPLFTFPLPTWSSDHLAHHHLALYLPSHVCTFPFMHLSLHAPPLSCTSPFMHLPLHAPSPLSNRSDTDLNRADVFRKCVLVY